MHAVAKNALWLAVGQIGSVAIPIIELPFLARGLGPASYGDVLFVLAVSLTASTLIEFGFYISAARRVILATGDDSRLRQIIADVSFAKLVLSGIVSIIILVVGMTGVSPTFSALMPWTICMSLAFGFSPMWYYLGTQRLLLPTLLDLALRSASLIGIVAFVKRPGDVWIAISLQGAAGLLNSAIPTIAMIRRTGFGVLDVKGVIAELRGGWHVFLYRGAGSLTATIASSILGLTSSPLQVGMFGPSEKLVRAGTSVVTTLLTALFPHLVTMSSADPAKAKRFVLWMSLGMLISLTGACAVVARIAGPLVTIVFGPSFDQAATLLAWVVFVIPLRSTSSALALLWFVPTGRERLASYFSIANLVLIILLGSFGSRIWGGIGVGAALLLCEGALLGALGTTFGMAVCRNMR